MFQALLDFLSDPTVLVTADGIVLSCNKAFAALVAGSAVELTGRSISSVTNAPESDCSAILERCCRSSSRLPFAIGIRNSQGQLNKYRVEGAVLERGPSKSLTTIGLRIKSHALATQGFQRLNKEIAALKKENHERQRIQHKLTDLQSRLTATLESMGDAVVTTDAQSRVTYLNPVAVQLLGYSSEEAVGQPLDTVFRIVHRDTRSPVESPIDRVLREGIAIGLADRTVLVRRDGIDVPIDDCATTIKDSSGQILGAVLLFRDVSDRQDSFRKAELLAAVVSSSEDAIMTKDLNGTVTSWNEGAVRIFGYTAEEMIGQPMRLLFPPDRQDEEVDILAQISSGQRITPYETVRRKKSGHFCDISLSVSPIRDEDGRIIGASTIARDITEHKRAQRALYESLERWKVTLESIGDAVLATDAQGHITFANAVALNLLGRVKADVIGRPLVHVFNILNEHTRSTVANPVDRVLRDGVVVGLANHTLLIRPDGSEVPIDDSAAPIFDLEGSLVGVILIFRDITERKEAESKLQRWSTELEARVLARTQELVHSQERLRGLASQLSSAERRERRRLANSLHDYLAQLLALARMKVSQTKQLRNTPRESETALTELDNVLQQCMSFTRSLMAQLSPSVLHDLGLVPALQWLAEQMRQQGLTVEVQVNTEEQPRLEDNEADMLFQSIRELLLNVIKHAGVLLATVVVEQDGDKNWLISVQDSGTGFEVGTMPNRPSASGERFGLFSIQERMELMGGHCFIDSKPGRGATVTLSLPISRPAMTLEPSLSPATIDKKTAPKPTGTRWRVLLVDDHVMVRQGLHSLLETYPDLEVVAVAADGEEAVEHALHCQPDVVLMDINLPKLNGIDATRRIKQRAPHILVIGLSVQTSAQTTEALLEAGGAILLSKEKAADDLYRTIAQLLLGTSNTYKV